MAPVLVDFLSAALAIAPVLEPPDDLGQIWRHMHVYRCAGMETPYLTSWALWDKRGPSRMRSRMLVSFLQGRSDLGRCDKSVSKAQSRKRGCRNMQKSEKEEILLDEAQGSMRFFFGEGRMSSTRAAYMWQA